jgi:type II secretory pathway pseudopilin PulG
MMNMMQKGENILRYMRSENRGVTLLELLVYAGILSITSSLMVGILSTLVRVQNNQLSLVEVSQQANFLIQTIQRNVRDSSVVIVKTSSSTTPLDSDASPAEGAALRIRMSDSTKGIVTIYLSSSTAKIVETNESTSVQTSTDITNSKVLVSNLSFQKRTNPPGHDTVLVSFTMSYNTSNPQLALTRNFQSAISRVSAAVFDSGIFPSTSGLNLGSASRPWGDVLVSGRIGVKNTSPTYDMDVTGGLRATATSTFSGYLGIGTTTPSVLAHIARSANDALTALFVQNSSASSSAIAQVAVGEDAIFKAASLRYIGSGGASSDLANTSSTGVIHAFASAVNGINFIAGGPNASIRFGTGGQATSNLRMIIDSSNRVGIGTSTPASGFHVVATTSTFGNSATSAIGQVQLIADTNNTPVSGRLTFGTDGTGWQFDISKNQGGTITDIVKITDSGTVGFNMTPAGPTAHVAANLGTVGAGTWIGAGCEASCAGAYAVIYADGTLTATNGGGSGETLRWDGTNLGIGNSSPTYYYKLDVVQNAVSGWAGGFKGPLTGNGGLDVLAGLTTGSASTCSPACILINWEDGDHTAIGSVTYTAGTVSYNAFTGSHIAEYRGDVDELEAGDLLVLTGKYAPWHEENPMGEPIYEVALSDKVNDKRVFGVYAYKAGDEESNTHKDKIYIYALGNAFMKVTDTNGDIETGDWITTSPRPRFGQRQEGDARRGYTVAKAQVSVDWSEVATDPKLDFKWKMIPVSLHAQ